MTSQITELDLRILQREYDWVLDVFKADLDIHYRRLQMMLALESVLMVGFALKDWGTSRSPYPAYLVCVVGMVLSGFWRLTSIGQWQFLELRRRMLRELEARMGCAVKILTIDRQVFHVGGVPYRFETTKEEFPDAVGLFSLGTRKARTMGIETSISAVFFVLWGAFLVWAILNLGDQDCFRIIMNCISRLL
jgi:hypothetical protein